MSFQSSGVVGCQVGAVRRPPISPGVSVIDELGDGVVDAVSRATPPPPNYTVANTTDGSLHTQVISDVSPSLLPPMFSAPALLYPASRAAVPPPLTPPPTFVPSSAVASTASAILLAPASPSSHLSSLAAYAPASLPAPSFPLSSGFAAVTDVSPFSALPLAAPPVCRPSPGFPLIASSARPLPSTITLTFASVCLFLLLCLRLLWRLLFLLLLLALLRYMRMHLILEFPGVILI